MIIFSIVDSVLPFLINLHLVAGLRRLLNNMTKQPIRPRFKHSTKLENGLFTMRTSKKEKLKPPMLGRREIQTLDLFWRQACPSLTAQNIRDLLESEQSSSIKLISINTIQSTIERLWRKGLLTRSKIGKAYIMTYLNNWNSELGSRVLALFNEHAAINKLGG